MEEMDRRSAFAFFSALAALGASGGPAFAQSGAPQPLQAMPDPAQSKIVHVADIAPVKWDYNGGLQRKIMSGTLPTGEFVEIHQSVLPPGKSPEPPHRHMHSEWIFVQEGTLSYLDKDKKTIPVKVGDMIFSASTVMHGMTNSGVTDATYIVFSVSKQVPLPAAY